VGGPVKAETSNQFPSFGAGGMSSNASTYVEYLFRPGGPPEIYLATEPTKKTGASCPGGGTDGIPLKVAGGNLRLEQKPRARSRAKTKKRGSEKGEDMAGLDFVVWKKPPRDLCRLGNFCFFVFFCVFRNVCFGDVHWRMVRFIARLFVFLVLVYFVWILPVAIWIKGFHLQQKTGPVIIHTV